MRALDPKAKFSGLASCCTLVTCLFLLSCGSDNKKEARELLQVFESGSGLTDEREVQKEREMLKTSLDESNDENSKKSEIAASEKRISRDEENDIKPESMDTTSNSPQLKEKQNNTRTERRVSTGPFTSVPVSKSRIISITSNRKGEIFLAEKKRVLKLEKHSSLQTKEVLSPYIYELDTSEEMPEVSHISFLNPSQLWVGFSNGQVAYRAGLEWKTLSGGPRFTNAEITSIQDASGAPFIGGTGMFQWDDEFKRFLTIGDAKGLSIRNIARSKNALLVSSNYNLYRIPFPEKSFSEIFKPFREDVPLGEVSTYEDNIFVGTRQGILMLSGQGYPLERFAEDIQVQKIFPIDDSKGIILSRQGSLHAYLGKKTFSTREAVSHAIADAHLDYSGKLWISQKVPVIYKGGLISIYKWIIKKSRAGNRDASLAKKYPNACDAYDDLIGKTNFSGNLSRTNIDGKDHVFLKGQMVCPLGTGTIRPDGLSIILTGWDISIHKRNSRDILKIPESIPADLATKIFLDSRNRLFLGTKRGLYIMNPGEKWSSPEKKELKEDYISDIKEDSKGNIWVASRIQNTSGETETPKDYQPLHILTPQGWAHFGTDQGLDSFGIAEISVSEEETLLASSQGFARISPKAEVSIQGPREGFTRSIIESITRDHYNRIWMGHGYFLSGMSWIKGSSLYLTTKEKGLFSDRIALVGLDSKDRIWVLDTGGRTGVYSYDELLKISEKRPYNKSRVKKNKLLQ